MKFGKHIQAHQVPGWSAYYLDYKFLKKIISSLAANRPASEAAALALGVRPPYHLTPLLPQPLSQPSHARSPATSPTGSPGQPPFFAASGNDIGRGPDFQAHKAAFFFKLERELEKINAFYLQKEAELKLRMETLLSKRRAAAMRGLPETTGDIGQNRVEWSAVEEGFRLLERDLGKLQQFVEINATGFRKILKKYDKRSTSTTKELYLARQVDVQPVFNRQLISELADTVATCLLDITDLSSGLQFEGPGANDIFAQQIMTERTPIGPFWDLENNFHKAVAASDSAAVINCVHYSELLSQQPAGRTNRTRILWNVIIEAPPELGGLILSTLSSPFDFNFIDDINGRTCLHEAAIAGTLRLVDLCIQHGVQVDKSDLYGRTALHYAAMNGHSSVCQQLLNVNVPPNTLDRDNNSPILYATMKGNADCIRVLLEEGHVPAQSPTSSGDLSPLTLAAQAGHVDVVVLLLKHGASCMPNTNGEYPMHLAAQEGHTDVCKLLLHREGWDTRDKYHEWTPLFHAARHGHDGCVSVLLDAGCRVHLHDELGHSAAHYAAWYGHQQVLSYLLAALKSSPDTMNLPITSNKSPQSDPGLSGEFEIDMIPSLSLPPPIMPHRVYGHNYLVKSHLVQVSIGQSSRKSKEASGVRVHHRLISPFFKDEYLLATTPLKLVMTTSPNVNSAPYTMSLPQRAQAGTFAFQTPSLDSLSLEFSIYPNFGTKTIGRAVALPSLFSGIENNQGFTLPILDHRLHIIGEVYFEINIITSFEGVTLEVGGDVETYWKSTSISSNNTALSGISREVRRPSHAGGSAHTSPAFSVSTGGGQALTITSLYGNYLHVAIQVTRDLHPVVYAAWLLPGTTFDLGVTDVTLAQFEELARSLGKDLSISQGSTPKGNWPQLISQSLLSLEQLLKILPIDVNVNLELMYPQLSTQVPSTSRRPDLNDFVDCVLRTIHNVSASIETNHLRRKISFSSFLPDVCSALNWKQPNYPVFFRSHCGRPSIGQESGITDQRVSNVGSAVEFAKGNNLLGIFVDAELLVQVPSLIDGIRSAELIVGVHGSSEAFPDLTSENDGGVVDAFVAHGFISFVDRSMRELS